MEQLITHLITAQKNITMQQNQTFGRYGKDTGSFATQPSVSSDKLSLPPNADLSQYRECNVVKPIPNVQQGIVAPWGGSSGGGLQYKLPISVKELLDQGYIIQIK